VPNVKKSGALTYPDPLGPSRRPVVGGTFTFTFAPFTGLRNFQSAIILSPGLFTSYSERPRFKTQHKDRLP